MATTLRPVLLIGSGASIASPANLALFRDIRETLLSAVTGELDRLGESADQINRRLGVVAPEVAFHSLQTAGMDVPSELVAAFNAARPRPNAVHEVVAHHLAAGGRVWTTNYDTLIERAWLAVTGLQGAPPGLVKAHGTFMDDADDAQWASAVGLVFASKQVITPWSEDDRAAFVAACAEAGELVVIGYSGADVNAREAVRAALRSVESVTWYQRGSSSGPDTEQRAWMALRFPELDPDRVKWSTNPSRDFVADQSHPDWNLVAPRDCPPDDHRCDLGTFAAAGGRPRVIAGLALETGERHLHRRMLRATLRSPDSTAQDVWWARRRRLAEAARIVRPLWNLAKPIAARVPNPKRSKARSTWIASHGLHSPKRAAKVEAQLYRWLPQAQTADERAALQLDRSRALRITGRYTDAVTAARDAMEIAIQDGDPTAAGHAEMETVEALRVLGRFDEALDAGAGRYDTLGLVHWYGWNAYEIGCAFLQLRRLEEAEIFIGHATDFFAGSPDGRETVYDRSLGHGYSLLAHAALRRLTAHLDEADEILGEVAATRYREGPEQIAVARQFQAAELARARGETATAEQLYEGLPPAWENYPTLSHLGLAYCAAGASGSDVLHHLEVAATTSDSQDSIFGLALCSQAAEDLGARDPVAGARAAAALAVRERIFADSSPDSTRPMAFL